MDSFGVENTVTEIKTQRRGAVSEWKGQRKESGTGK